MIKTTYTAIVTAAVALLIAVLAFAKVPTVGPAGPQGPQGERGPVGAQGSAGLNGQRGPAGADAPVKLGATGTLDGVQNPFVSINGLAQYNYDQQIAATSSVFCSIRNPYNATSTLKNYHIVATSNGLGAQTFDISTSSTAIGSSSPMLVKAFTTGAGQFNAIWGSGATTTNSNLIGLSALPNGASDVFLRPGEYLNARIATGTPGTFAGGYFKGYCGGVIEKL